jgi:hypothetical protein
MRWVAKDSERKPDPEPIKGTAKFAVVFGMAGFLIALVLILVFYNQIDNPHKIWYPYTCVAGLLLGVFALFRVRDR